MRNLTLSFLGSISNVMGIAAMFFVTAAVMSQKDYAIFASTYALASLLGTVAGYGYGQRILSESRSDNAQTMSTAMISIQLMIAVALCGPGLFYTVLFNGDVLVFFGIYIGVISQSLANSIQAVFRSKHRHWDDAILRTSSRMLLVVVIFFAAMLGVDSPKYFAVFFLISSLLELMASLYWFSRSFNFRTEIELLRQIKFEFRSGLIFLFDVMMQRIFGTVDILIVNAIAQPEEIATYIIAQKFAQLFLVGLQAIMNAQLPILTEAWANQFTYGAYRKETIKTYAMSAANGFIGFVGMNLVANSAIIELAGSNRVDASMVFAIFGIAVAIRSIGSAYELKLISSGNQSLRVRINFIGALMLCIVLPISSNFFSSTGAACAILFVWTFSSCQLLHAVQKVKIG